jgi:hypothetical protein
MAHISVRGVFVASCVWGGFALVALLGLYLKHFLATGAGLRRQFLLSVFLLTVTGLDICVHLWNLFYSQRPPPGDLEWWSVDQIASWLDSLLWVPHHVASMVCCMFAFLLAWMAGKDNSDGRTRSGVFIALALASSFGLSVYVAFAFFLAMLAWAIWQVAYERKPLPALLLGAGGGGGAILLLPYLWELTHTTSKMRGSSVFAFAVRQMIPPQDLLTSRLFQHLASHHPLEALNLAKLILLAPGYALELGFYLAVLVAYLVPRWRGGIPLTPAHRSLVLIVVATLGPASFVRSTVLGSNDFGWRSVLLLQFPLLLLASELLSGWRFADGKCGMQTDGARLPYNSPQWLRSIASIALVIGVVGTPCQALMLRFAFPLAAAAERSSDSHAFVDLSHNAYISSVGYAKLDASISHDAIVQFSPNHQNPFGVAADMFGIDHQAAIISDEPWRGSELGGDPAGCPAMASAIDALYTGASAEQARATCRQYSIQYLLVRIYDPAWKDRQSWVWTLTPVVPDQEFRVLDCR